MGYSSLMIMRWCFLFLQLRRAETFMVAIVLAIVARRFLEVADQAFRVALDGARAYGP